MKNIVKQILNKSDCLSLRAKKLIIVAGIGILAVVSCAVGFHVVANAITGTTYTLVEIDESTQDDYLEQIQTFIQYDSMEGMTWARAYENKGRIHVHIFDGYVDDIFVFEDDVLRYTGSSVTPDLLPVEAFELPETNE